MFQMFNELRRVATDLSFVDFVRMNLAMSTLTSLVMAVHSFVPGKISNAPLFPLAENELTKIGDRMLGHAHLLMTIVRAAAWLDYKNKTVYYLGLATFPVMLGWLWSETWIYETSTLDSPMIGFLSIYLPTMTWLLWRGRAYIRFDQDRLQQYDWQNRPSPRKAKSL